MSILQKPNLQNQKKRNVRTFLEVNFEVLPPPSNKSQTFTRPNIHFIEAETYKKEIASTEVRNIQVCPKKRKECQQRFQITEKKQKKTLITYKSEAAEIHIVPKNKQKSGTDRLKKNKIKITRHVLHRRLWHKFSTNKIWQHDPCDMSQAR